MSILKYKIFEKLENYLQDWNKDDNFKKQCDDLSNQLEEIILDTIKQQCIPDHSICFYKNGDKWICINGDFIDFQESPFGISYLFDGALKNLQDSIAEKSRCLIKNNK